jgi:hypothetical protein
LLQKVIAVICPTVLKKSTILLLCSKKWLLSYVPSCWQNLLSSSFALKKWLFSYVPPCWKNLLSSSFAPKKWLFSYVPPCWKNLKSLGDLNPHCHWFFSFLVFFVLGKGVDFSVTC